MAMHIVVPSLDQQQSSIIVDEDGVNSYSI